MNEHDHILWGANVCIRLRPQEPLAWVLRVELTDKDAKWFHSNRLDAYVILGQPKPAVEETVALLKAEELRERFLLEERSMKERPHGAFVLAMVRWKLGQEEDARRLYDKGVKWMDENKPKDETLLRFRDEAAKLLGIPVKPPAAKEKTEGKG
jgi:hypothetical protein